MARIDNAITFGSGFNISSTGPIDSRMRVEYESDLIDAATWPSDKAPLYDGMPVVVMETAEIWVLKDKTKFTDKTTGQGWVKSSGGGDTPVPPEPLCFTAQEANSTIGLERLSTNQTLEYSTDLTTWSAMTTATTITLANSGDTVYIRGILSANNTSSNYTQFKMTGKIAASGNCNYLWNYETPDVPLKQYCGFNMFTNCTGLTTAPELPATALANYCYIWMFGNCTSLTTAPELPATALTGGCYSYMFSGCTSLTTAPELPATTLANNCYEYMFNGCSGLTIAPELPATTLAGGCYSYMFSGCTSLTTAPELPATTLAVGCYSSMFRDCSSLNYIKCLATNISAANCIYYWVSGVTSSGTFVKESTMTGWPLDDVNGIPSGWTVYDHYSDVELDKKLDTKQDKDIPEPLCFTALETGVTIGIVNDDGDTENTPNIEYSINDGVTWTTWDYGDISLDDGEDGKVFLRGMNLGGFSTSFSKYSIFTMSGSVAASGNIMALIDYTQKVDIIPCDYCFYSIFRDCSGLTTAPELPATTLATNCYNGMFQYCSGLTTAPELPATTLTDLCYYAMFVNCTSLTTAPELPATTLANYCYSNMFVNCTSLTTAPELPATTLAAGCYQSMFNGCSGLTTAPELLATTLANNCYGYMFVGCTSLTTAPELPATTLASGCYTGMFQGCTSLTSAPELPATTLVDNCYNGMFRNCRSLNYIKCLSVNGINQNNSTYQWVNGVANSGTFVKESTMTGWPLDNVNGIPSGWTVYDHYSDVELDKKLDTIQDKVIPEPLCFTALQANSTIGLEELSSSQTLEYSRDLTTWSAMTTANTITLANSGDSCYIRGVLSANNSINDFTQFTMSGSISASGDCNSLWDYENLDAPLKEYCGYHMFYGCNSLTTPPDLPSTVLTEYCYALMFENCSSLVRAPELPAIKLANNCYLRMFYACDDLTTAPELPATTLAIWCYYAMFQGCTSLTTAPVLPASTLANECYSGMFNGCTSLTTAPELPATTLAQYCYSGMFRGCTSLATAPELPATTLANNCYESMFYGCTSLTTVPELPATTLANNCYIVMFSGCTSLNYIKCLATNISASECTSSWVSGVASVGTFVKESTMTGWTLDDDSGIPSGWTVYGHYTDVELDKKIDINVTVSDVLAVLNDDTND